MIDIRVKTERHSKLLMSLVSSGVDGHDFSSLHNEVYMSNSLILFCRMKSSMTCPSLIGFALCYFNDSARG